MSRVTSTDIARILGISQATVSRALNNHPEVSAATRARVQAAAADLGYTLHPAARFLARRCTGVFGLLVDPENAYLPRNPYLSQILHALARACIETGWSIRLEVTADHTPPAASYRNRVDGMIVSQVKDVNLVCQRLTDERVPFVLLRRRPPAGIRAAYIDSDDEAGIRAAVHRLYDLGHRAIGYLGSASTMNARRWQAYEQAVKELGLPAGNSAVLDGNPNAISDLMRTKPPLTALVCYDDLKAQAVLEWCHARRISVPQQLSVVGFGDVEFAEHTVPPLTTMHMPLNDMVNQAVKALAVALEKGAAVELQAVLPCRLVERGSVAPL